MSIFKIIKSWFTKETVKTTQNVEVSNVEVTVEESVVATKPEFVDILGNELKHGDYVVRVKYNDKRDRYLTIAENHDVLTYNKNIRFKVLSYEAFQQATKTPGRKHGYLHVAR